jgi:DNA processing protein
MKTHRRHTPCIPSQDMSILTHEHDDTTEVVVEMARHWPDSWISVNDTVDRLIADGSSLRAVAEAIDAFCPRLWLHGEAPFASAVDRVMRPALSGGFTVIDATSDHYPSELHVIDGRPLLLYVKGQLPHRSKSALAVVGSRQATRDGLSAAFRIAAAVARAGHPIISGLAQGIDTAAHKGALSVDGTTIAVMGTGIDQVFPSENTDLAKQIADHGALVSQFAPGQGPSKTTFPSRNAVIAGLSDASLLVELNERSGTRIEAERALEQGKPVWLWGPRMRSAEWATAFAQRPGVSFVDTIEEVLDRLLQLEVQ